MNQKTLFQPEQVSTPGECHVELQRFVSLPGLRGLTLWEPYATLICLGAKTCETRSWPAPKWLIGNPVVVHAAKKFDRTVQWDINRVRFVLQDCRFEAPDLPCASWKFEETLGCALAVAVVDRCEEATGTYSKLDREFGEMGPGRYAWHLSPVITLQNPVKWKGAQGLWPVPPELRERILSAG